MIDPENDPGKNKNFLGETSVEGFLNHYWQKKPLLALLNHGAIIAA